MIEVKVQSEINQTIKERISQINQSIVPKGYKETEVGIIPDDWEVKNFDKIKDETDRYSYAGGPFGSNLKVSDFTKNGIRVLQLQNIGDGDFLNNHKVYTSIAKADELKSSNIYPGDILIAKMADPLARSCIVPDFEERYLMASDGIRLSLSRNHNSVFIKEMINSPRFRSKAEARGTGSTRKRINLTDLRTIPLAVPNLEEQQKIADILSTWERAIELKESLIKEKEEQKKGLMQKLLTGEKRLKGFTETWRSYSLKELSNKLTDGDWIESRYITSKGIRLIQTGNIGIGEFLEQKNKRYISAKSFDSLNCTEVTPGDILISRLADPIGRACIAPDLPEKMITAVDVAILRVNHELVINTFLNYMLNLPKTMQAIDRLGAGSTRKRVSRKNMEKVILSMPSLCEQQRIAKILSTADQEIDLLKQEVEQVKEQKKGLMQLLLAGIVRVKEAVTSG